MWKREHSKIYQNVDKAKAWQLMIDINNWPTWHDDLEYCKLQGAFEVGSYFILKPKGGPKVKIVLTEIEVERKLTDCTHFFGAKMYDIHEFIEHADGLELKNTLIVTGPLKWLWIKLVAQNVADSVPHENDTLIKLVQDL